MPQKSRMEKRITNNSNEKKWMKVKAHLKRAQVFVATTVCLFQFEKKFKKICVESRSIHYDYFGR